MSVPPEDSALMLRYGDGDLSAFQVLYSRHNDALFRYLLRLSGNPDTAADIFQEVWGKIIKARASYRPTAKFTTWMYRVAHNCFIDSVRRNKRYSSGPDYDADELASDIEGPEAQAEKAFARERLMAALRQLPHEQRNAFLLREEAGLSIEEIARVTGVAPETAKSRLRYAMNKLSIALAKAPESSALPA
ncbi:MAG: RNA polymerase sigma factor [Halioglobus sp.]|nr:RNA polymerase sigma factor [Halioglobus sp.]